MKTKLNKSAQTRTLKLGAMGLAVTAATAMSGFSQITWQSPTVISTTATLDAIPGEYAGATLVQSVGFGIGSVQTVATTGGQTIPFSVGVFNSSWDSGVTGTGTMLGYSGGQTLASPSTGSAAFNAVLAGDGWAEGNGPTAPQTLQIGGLTVGTTYAIDLFAYDPRSGSASRTEEFADTLNGTGNDSASFSTASAASVIGTFTATSALEDVYVIDTMPGAGAGNWDTTVSGITLYSAVPEPGTCALALTGVGVLLGFRARRKA